MTHKHESLILGASEEQFSEEDSEPGGLKDYCTNGDSKSTDSLPDIDLKVRSSIKVNGELLLSETETFRNPIWIWTIWSIGIGLFCNPYYFKSVGVIFCFILHLVCYLVNCASFQFIFTASSITKCNFMPDVVSKLLGKKTSMFFDFSLTCDMTVGFFGCILYSWQLFIGTLVLCGLTKDEWYTDASHSKILDYHPEVFCIRAGFYIVSFLLSIPLLLKRRLSEFSTLMNTFFFFVMIAAFLLLLQMPDYLLKFKADKTLVIDLMVFEFSTDTIETVYNLITIQCLQPYILYLKDEITNPTPKKLTKIVWKSTAVIQLLNVSLGIICYLCLGRINTPLYLFDKQKINTTIPVNFVLVICLSGILLINCLNSVLWNPSFRLLINKVTGSTSESGASFYAKSIMPFGLFCILSIFFPAFNRSIYVFGCFFCIFDSYVVPCLCQIEVEKGNKGYFRKIGLWIYAVVFFFFGLLSNVFQIYMYSNSE